MTDVVFNDNKGFYDFDWTDSGDFSTDNSFDTAILLSIFDEARADKSEVAQSHLRRGALINETQNGFEQGSKSWEFEQARVTGSSLLALGDTIRKALQWMLDDGIAERINVQLPFLKNGRVVVNIDFFRDGAQIETRFYELWNNSGQF